MLRTLTQNHKMKAHQELSKYLTAFTDQLSKNQYLVWENANYINKNFTKRKNKMKSSESNVQPYSHQKKKIL